jgi:transposase-like protein
MPTTPRPLDAHGSPTLTAGVCIIHLIRNTFRLASKRDWDALKRGIRPICTAVNAGAAAAALDELEAGWGARYPAVIRLWRSAWQEFIPFLDYDVEIRQVICTTNAWVILSPKDGRGCDLGCFVEDSVLEEAG